MAIEQEIDFFKFATQNLYLYLKILKSNFDNFRYSGMIFNFNTI